jgi:hypothetical protein
LQVLPPRYRHYNLDTFGYEDFFDIEDMKKIVPVISFEEFQKIENVPDGYAVRVLDFSPFLRGIIAPNFHGNVMGVSGITILNHR